MQVKRQIGIFLYGAVGYAAIEILSRGYTHWSMALAGGSCLVLLAEISRRLPGWNLLLQAAVGATAITVVEFLFGVVCNLWLGLGIWSYAEEPMNLLGQVCLRFTGLWYLLALAVLLYFRIGSGKAPQSA